MQEALQQVKTEVNTIKEQTDFPKPPSLDELEEFLSQTTEELNDLDSPQEPENASEQIEPTEVPETRTESLAERAARAIKLNENSYQQPEALDIDPKLASVIKKVQFLEQWISKISLAGPGGGETKLRFLDDVNRNTIQDRYYLRYDNPTNKFVFDTGMYYAYHGSFFSNVTQYSNVANIPTAITFNNTDLSNQVFLRGDSNIVCNVNGVYNFQFSLQLDHTSGGESLIYIWPRINELDVPNSATKLRLKQQDDEKVASWNFVYQINANDNFQLMWASDSGFVQVLAEPISITYPAIPSVIFTVVPVQI